ncbi:hypothetical protein MRX96_044729 [Rhipicephalus microplus]
MTGVATMSITGCALALCCLLSYAEGGRHRIPVEVSHPVLHRSLFIDLIPPQPQGERQNGDKERLSDGTLRSFGETKADYTQRCDLISNALGTGCSPGISESEFVPIRPWHSPKYIQRAFLIVSSPGRSSGSAVLGFGKEREHALKRPIVSAPRRRAF